LQSRRGAAGWQLAWTAWRDRVVAGTSFPHAMALLRVANQHPADIGMVLDKASALAGDDVGRKLAVARQAASFGQPGLAQALVEPIAKATPSREAFQLLAQIQLAQNRRPEALAALEAAQDAGSDEQVSINVVRAELSQIIEVARQLAITSSGAARDAAVATAMKWGARWRELDVGNPAIDQVLGALQLAVGNRQEAWRQLSGVIERDPMSGDGYQIVANAFEQQGRVADALELWHMAIIIDQTNPTPRLRRAQALIALGNTAEGDAQLREIVDDKRWHTVWSGVVEQARQLLARAKQRQP
jgi:tetratricopeptide (TPR) repeat protein